MNKRRIEHENALVSSIDGRIRLKVGSFEHAFDIFGIYFHEEAFTVQRRHGGVPVSAEEWTSHRIIPQRHRAAQLTTN